ncbi:hypothetical protein OAG57_03255 [Akkermansiaceae bacterium]|nr:hypothetical protein [Akkermansiaceae bacterium]
MWCFYESGISAGFARGGGCYTLGEMELLVGLDACEDLRFRAGPVNDDFFDNGIFTKAKV